MAARLGLFAVLFQAILFGWHHHDVTFAGRLPAPIIENPAASPQILNDEDGCEICQVLHHLTAAPVDVVAAPVLRGVAAGSVEGDADVVVRTPSLAFHARGPPLFDAAIG